MSSTVRGRAVTHVPPNAVVQRAMADESKRSRVRYLLTTAGSSAASTPNQSFSEYDANAAVGSALHGTHEPDHGNRQMPPPKDDEPTSPNGADNITVVRSLDVEIPMTFPQKLMEILSSEDYRDVISWLRHGRGFMIHQKKRFTAEVLPRYFPQSKFTSFTRKLNRWGFIRVTRGPETGAYCHELFLRDNHHLCLQMCCYSGVKSRTGPFGPILSAPPGVPHSQFAAAQAQAPSQRFSSASPITAADRQRQLLQALARAKAETEAVRRAMLSLGPVTAGAPSLSPPSLEGYPRASASANGSQQQQQQQQSPEALAAAISALRMSNQAAYLELLRSKATSGASALFVGFHNVTAQTAAALDRIASERRDLATGTLTSGGAQQQQVHPLYPGERVAAAPQKRYRASAA